MQKQATIIRWDAARGFGFMRSTHTTADVFFNIRDWVAEGEQPSDGLEVFYEEIELGGKAPHLAVRPVNYTAPARQSTQPAAPAAISPWRARRLSNALLMAAVGVLLALLVALGWTWIRSRR
ncbi:MAG: colD-shock DNA-binding protein [Rhizobacter sp.]|nr:colD-shock DNA-binding protein [Rhizobacter sp.]